MIFNVFFEIVNRLILLNALSENRMSLDEPDP